jgi:hypothetical protein
MGWLQDSKQPGHGASVCSGKFSSTLSTRSFGSAGLNDSGCLNLVLADVGGLPEVSEVTPAESASLAGRAPVSWALEGEDAGKGEVGGEALGTERQCLSVPGERGVGMSKECVGTGKEMECVGTGKMTLLPPLSAHLPEPMWPQTLPACARGHEGSQAYILKRVLPAVTLHGKCTRALTCQNFVQGHKVGDQGRCSGDYTLVHFLCTPAGGTEERPCPGTVHCASGCEKQEIHDEYNLVHFLCTAGGKGHVGDLSANGAGVAEAPYAAGVQDPARALAAGRV